MDVKQAIRKKRGRKGYPLEKFAYVDTVRS